MAKSDIMSKLQSEFECKRCGMCECRGGQILITDEEANKICDYCGIDRDNGELFPFTPLLNDPNYLFPLVTEPCFFWDKITGDCMIQEVKPQFCIDYPWVLYRDERCNLADIVICPEVRRTVDKLLRCYPEV